MDLWMRIADLFRPRPERAVRRHARSTCQAMMVACLASAEARQKLGGENVSVSALAVECVALRPGWKALGRRRSYFFEDTKQVVEFPEMYSVRDVMRAIVLYEVVGLLGARLTESRDALLDAAADEVENWGGPSELTPQVQNQQAVRAAGAFVFGLVMAEMADPLADSAVWLQVEGLAGSKSQAERLAFLVAMGEAEVCRCVRAQDMEGFVRAGSMMAFDTVRTKGTAELEAILGGLWEIVDHYRAGLGSTADLNLARAAARAYASRCGVDVDGEEVVEDFELSVEEFTSKVREAVKPVLACTSPLVL